MDILRRYLFLYTRHRRAYVLGGVWSMRRSRDARIGKKPTTHLTDS